MKKIAILIFFLTFSIFKTLGQNNLIQNGTFLGTNGWSNLAGTTGGYAVPGGGNISVGDNFYQNIPTVMGDVYQVSFYIGTIFGAQYPVYLGLNGYQIGPYESPIGTNFVFNNHNDHYTWGENFSSFVANSTTTEVQFSNPSVNILLADVSVVESPEPPVVFLAIMGSLPILLRYFFRSPISCPNFPVNLLLREKDSSCHCQKHSRLLRQ